MAFVALGLLLEACTSPDTEKPKPVVTTPATTQPEEPGPPTPVESDTAPSPVETEPDIPGKPEPGVTTRSSQVPEPEETAETPAAAYYENCAAAQDAGAAPLVRGGPGYRDELDRDGDGVACEPAP